MITSKPFLVASLIRILLPAIFIYSKHNTPYLRKRSSSVLLHPTYSLDHLREGDFLSRFGESFQSAYGIHTEHEGSVSSSLSSSSFHLPPLLYALVRPLSFSDNEETHHRYCHLLFSWFCSTVDAAIVICLINIMSFVVARSHEEEKQGETCGTEGLASPEAMETLKPKPPRFVLSSSSSTYYDMAALAPLLYYCNPWVVGVAGFMGNFQNIVFLCYLLPLMYAMKGNAPLACFWLAWGVYLDVKSVVFLVPVILLLVRQGKTNRSTGVVVLASVALFFLWTILLFHLSNQLVAGGAAPWSVYDQFYKMNDSYQPSLSPMWYFSVQLFNRFRSYFRVLAIGLPYLSVAPLTIRFWRYPIELATSLLLLQYALNPIQTLPNLCFIMSNILLSPLTISRMGTLSTIALLCLPVPIILSVVFFWLWLDTGTGNPNFLFFQCAGFNVFLVMIILDYIDAVLLRDKAKRIIAKLRC